MTGKTGRCDFCERPINTLITPKEIPLYEWSPATGLDVLVGQLVPSGDVRLPQKNSDARMHSLLGAAKDASSINNVDITFGITTGVLIGAIVSIPVGMYLFDNGIVRTRLDKMGLVLVGIVGGAVVGALVHALLKRSKVAVAKIRAACENYGIDTVQLEELSLGYSGVVQRAVRVIRDSCSA